MLFTLQKIIWFLLLPPAGPLLLIAAGAFIADRRKPAGKALILSGVLVLYLLSLSATADLILRPLEGRYPPLAQLPKSIDAVVVPGGGSVDLAWMPAEPVPNAETTTRLAKGVQVAGALHAPLVLTGGNGEPFATRLRDADVMAPAALAMGLPKKQLIVENESRNTLENSHAVRKLVRGNRIVLVASAYYMRRAVALFERRGFTVTPAPVYFLSQTRKFNLTSLIPGASSLARSSIGIAEWLGMAWWKVRGEL